MKPYTKYAEGDVELQRTEHVANTTYVQPLVLEIDVSYDVAAAIVV